MRTAVRAVAWIWIALTLLGGGCSAMLELVEGGGPQKALILLIVGVLLGPLPGVLVLKLVKPRSSPGEGEEL